MSAGSASGPRGAWRLAHLTLAPHRLCFFWAGVLWAASALAWAAVQLGLPVPAGLPGTALHGLLFALGPLPLFFVGFLCTAGPKWLRQPPVEARSLRGGVAAFVAGWAVLAASAHAGFSPAAGLALAGAGLSVLMGRVAALVLASTHTERLHPALMTAALALAAAALWASALALWLGRADWLSPIARAGLWWGVVAVFVTVGDRLLPFFGDGAWPWADARWPHWALAVLLSVPLVQGAAALVPLPPWLLGVHLLLVCGVSLRLLLRWLGTPPLRQAMVWQLHVAQRWWCVALALGAAAALLPAGEWALRLQHAALHALTVGYVGGTMLAMTTRVSATQAGRALAIDGWAKGLFVLLQAAVLLRLLAALWPAVAPWALPAAACTWAAVALCWAVRHGRWFGQAGGR